MRKAKKTHITIGNKTYFLDKKTDLENFKNISYLLYKENQGSNEKFFNYLMGLSKILFPNIPLPFENDSNMSDRDYLDINIEAYQALYFLFAGRTKDYENLTDFERFKIFKDDKLMHLLLTYKIEKYGNEIFKSLGMEIVDKVDNGYIIRDLDHENKPIN